MTKLNCKTCGESKPESSFGTYTSRGHTYHRVHCKDCRNKEASEARDDRTRWLEREQYRRKVEEDKQGTSDYYRDWHLRKKYGITLDEFNQLSEAQGNKCCICSEENKVHQNLVVDHNHATGEVRGLICSPCNSALGLAKDSVKVLEAMIEYLNSRGSYGD